MNTVVTGKRGFQLAADIFLAAVVLMAAGISFGQSALDGFDPNVSGSVYAITPQPDGKILIGGSFGSIGGVARTLVGRILANGQVDTTFVTESIAPGSIQTLVLQSNGQVVIGGSFMGVGDASRDNIARLNADGSLDASFNPGANGDIFTLAVQADGKILVGGEFIRLGNQVRTCLGRLNADGTLDTTFNPTVDGTISAIAVQADGKILVGGFFTLLNNQPRMCMGRLNTDGTLDTTFGLTNGPNDDVHCLAIQADGKILVGGEFWSVGGQDHCGIARVNTDGSMDASFTAIIDNTVESLAIQPDGKILVGGAFPAINGDNTRIRIGRLNPDGTLDTTFLSPGGALDTVYALAVQADGNAIVGGSFHSLGGVARNHIGRLYPDGRTDNNFLDAVADPALGALGGVVYAMAQQTDGQLIVGGAFHHLSGVGRNKIGRFAVDGTLDATFNPNADSSVLAIMIQSDGRILIGGLFQHLGVPEYKYIARLDSAGNPEAGFNPQLDGGGVYCIVPQPDGKIIVAGFFTKIGVTDCLRIGRLNSDGTLDGTFNVPSGADDSIYSAILQPDGKILVAGRFTHLGGVARNHIGRLNSDGSLDTAFDPSANDGSVYALALQTDGKILLGGNFETMGTGAADCKRIGRLNSDGTLDTSFVVPSGANGSVRSIALQTDGKTLVSGAFTQIGGLDRLCIARLNSNGSVDTDYAPQNGDDWPVNSMVLQPDGKVIAGGEFDQLTGYKRNYIGRLSAVSAAIQNLAVNSSATAISWTRTGSGPELDTVTFEKSLDGTTWSTLGAGSRLTNGWQITRLNLPRNTNLYLRAYGFYRCGNYNDSVSVCESVRLFYLPNRCIGDYDGDLKSDLAVYGNGYWYITSLANGHIFLNGKWGAAGWTPVPGDYDGDGKADLAVFGNGYWYIHSLANGNILLNGKWGAAGWTPVPGDYDGDGKADLAVYRDGYWYINSLANGIILLNGKWGAAGWTPVPGDYDGDGKADLAVFGDGYWYINSLANGIILLNGKWGAAGWTPVPGDYDGDGKADLAVFGNGYWYIHSLANGNIFLNGKWGAAGWTPVPGDYDGDGKADLAVYRDGYWYINSLANGSIFLNGKWGAAGWTPVY